MTSFKPTKLDPGLNIHGSTTQTDTLTPGDEVNQLGTLVLGQTGSNATIASVAAGQVTITGLTGMTSDSVTRVIHIFGAADPNNNGTFPITSFISSTSVVYFNAVAALDANSGFISWQERNNYSLQDDLNYTRTDRSNIKGTPYYGNIPTYQRPDNVGTNVPNNLVSIAGHTADALAYVMNLDILGVSVLDGYTNVLLVSPGNLKHADNVNTLGVPLLDTGPFAGDYLSCTAIIQDATIGGGELVVQAGLHAGERVIGITKLGTSVSPNSVDVVFYSVPITSQVSNTTITPYSWELAQPNIVNITIGYNERLDQIDKNAFRSRAALGAISGSIDFDFLLESEPPKPSNIYTNTISSGKVVQEKWNEIGSNHLIKTIDYTYSGSTVVTEVRKVYDAPGTTVLAQITKNYVVSNNTIISITTTRDI